MLRKSVLALAAIAALSAAALAPTSASAGGKFFHKKHFGFGLYPTYYAPYDCFWHKKLTPFGIRFVKVCSYW
jgi:hypothetical protein